jgi:hypothetical protein
MNGRVFDCGAGKDRWTDTRSNVMAQDSESIRTLAGVLVRVIRRGIARDAAPRGRGPLPDTLCLNDQIVCRIQCRM